MPSTSTIILVSATLGSLVLASLLATAVLLFLRRRRRQGPPEKKEKKQKSSRRVHFGHTSRPSEEPFLNASAEPVSSTPRQMMMAQRDDGAYETAGLMAYEPFRGGSPVLSVRDTGNFGQLDFLTAPNSRSSTTGGTENARYEPSLTSAFRADVSTTSTDTTDIASSYGSIGEGVAATTPMAPPQGVHLVLSGVPQRHVSVVAEVVNSSRRSNSVR